MSGEYPECEKLAQVSEKSQELGYFLEWLMQRCVLAEWDESEEGGTDDILYPIHKSIEQILAEYFHIDMDKVNEERAQILKELRSQDEKAGTGRRHV